MLSKKCTYAIRSVLYLGISSKEQEKKSGKEVAENLDAPAAFIVKILQELVRHGLVQSQKGPTGGFFLSNDNLEMKLLKIVELIDGLDWHVNCGLGLSECSCKSPCPFHDTYSKVRTDVYKWLSQNRVIDIAKNPNALSLSFTGKVEE
jgi:Rrf2 family transcriptional regulator, iron-sulfur cluster assembly transcription factor